MTNPQKLYYEKRGQTLVKNLKARHFDACYCETAQDALKKALEWIPEGSSVGWGGALSAQQIGLMDALRKGAYRAIDRDSCTTPEEKRQAAQDCLSANVFITGANAISLDGQMVNIDGNGNRLACLMCGPEQVLVIAGMNKVVDDVESAVQRVGTHAAPPNAVRLGTRTPCATLGHCNDCHSDDCMCAHIVVTRHSRQKGRIKVILVGEELGY